MSSDPCITLVTGGARSGKSALAETIAARHEGARIYIATAEARDDEMTQRIGLHRDRRGSGWRTVEEPRDLAGALARTDGQGARLV
ncbi:bifunctional adenosylcobinamide kinase/adenosylcobinamide-phosphate guanylyltransferase, partial [Paracoccus denitrificans]